MDSPTIIDADFNLTGMELVPAEENQSFANYDFAGVDDGLSDELSRLPIYSIDKDTGMIVNKTTGEEFTTIRMAWIDKVKGRTHFPPNFGDEPTWFCRATDFENGILNEEKLTAGLLKELKEAGAGGVCAKCKLQVWVGKKPDCSIVRTIMGYDFDTGTPFVTSGAKTKLRPIEDLQDGLVLKRNHFKKLHGKIIPVQAFEVIFTSKKVSNGKMDWFIPQFTITGKALKTVEDIKTMLALRTEYHDLFHRRAAEEPESQNEEANAEDGNGKSKSDDGQAVGNGKKFDLRDVK